MTVDAATSGSRDKRERFVSLAERRMVNAIRAVRIVGNLSNKAHYEFTDADVNKIVSTLQREVAQLERRFKEPSLRARIDFKL